MKGRQRKRWCQRKKEHTLEQEENRWEEVRRDRGEDRGED